MWDEIKGLLDSADPRERLLGLRKLHSQSVEFQFVPTREQLRHLAEFLWREQDRHDEVWRLGVTVLSGLAPLWAREKERGPRQQTLAGWLWEPFHRQSVVLRGVDGMWRRDEEAVVALARHLSRTAFPNTTFLSVNLDEPEWEKTLGHRPVEALCIIGRLGLYGPEASEKWRPTNPRFYFADVERPAKLPLGKLDPRFHAIGERGRPEPYRAQEEGEQRIDYGIVQRYPVKYLGKKIVVVACAGASSLGTLAAARWAVESLPERDLQGEYLPLPERITPDSRLEALVTVKARIAPYPQDWRPLDWDIASLFVDRWKWSERDRRWQRIPPQEIVLVHPQGEPEQPAAVLFDGEKATFHKDAVILRLLVRVCQLASQAADGRVEIARLVQDHWIWGEKSPRRTLSELQVRTARNRLHQLKNIHLGEALDLEDTAVKLNARVRLQAQGSASDEPAAAEAGQE